jgi:hypothetical protein
MNPVKITGTSRAWTTSKWRDIDYINHQISEGKNDEAISEMSYTKHDMSNSEKWVEVGTAEITVTFFSRDIVVAKELDGLNAQLQKVRAENQRRENAILDQISKLQALDYTAPAPAMPEDF